MEERRRWFQALPIAGLIFGSEKVKEGCRQALQYGITQFQKDAGGEAKEALGDYARNSNDNQMIATVSNPYLFPSAVIASSERAYYDKWFAELREEQACLIHADRCSEDLLPVRLNKIVDRKEDIYEICKLR